MSARVAYAVELDGVKCICFGVTKAAAKWQAVRSWREAGFGQRGEWPRTLKAARSPEYDSFNWAHRRCAWVEDYVAALLRGES